MADSITTFVTFKMPSNAKDMFKEEWLKDFAFMARQPGQKGGALYYRAVSNGQVEFINVSHWENEDALNDAREAVVMARQREGRDQVSYFQKLGVSFSAENYVVDVPY